MARFAVRRLVAAVGVLFVISVLTFLIFRSSRTATRRLESAGQHGNAATIREIDRVWGFDKPIYVQYLKTMGQIFSGTVVSYSQGVNVLDSIRQGLPATLSLAIGAGIIWFVFGVLFGVITAVRAGRFSDRSLTVLAFIGVSVPPFFLGALADLLPRLQGQHHSARGLCEVDPESLAVVQAPDAPWLVLSVLFIGIYSRVTARHDPRHDHEDFVRTARAKGLSETQVLFRHVLRN